MASCSAHQDAWKNILLDLEVTLRSHDLRPTVDLDLMRLSYPYVDVYQWEDLDGIVTFALAWSVKKHWQKIHIVLSAATSTFLLLWRCLPNLKTTLVKIVYFVRVYPVPLPLVSSLLRFRGLTRGRISPPSVRSWPRHPSVRGLRWGGWNVDRA